MYCQVNDKIISDLLYRSIEEFDSNIKDKDIAEKRYEHYLERLMKTINQVLIERHKLS